MASLLRLSSSVCSYLDELESTTISLSSLVMGESGSSVGRRLILNAVGPFSYNLP